MKDDQIKIQKRLSHPLVSPPESLRKLSRFSGAEQRADFLGRSWAFPETFWEDISDELPWTTTPVSVLSKESWYPGGRLNVARICLEGAVDSTVLWKREATGHPVQIGGRALSRMVSTVARMVDDLGLSQGDTVMVLARLDVRMIVIILALLHRGLVVCPMISSTDPARVKEVIAGTGCKALITTEPEAKDVPMSKVLVLPELPEESEPFHENILGSQAPAFIFPGPMDQKFTITSAGFISQSFSAFRHLLADKAMDSPLWLSVDSRVVAFVAAGLGALASGSDLGVVSSELISSSGDLASLELDLSPRRLLVDTIFLSRILKGEAPSSDRSEPASLELFLIEGDTLLPREWSAARRLFAPEEIHVAQLLARPEVGGFVAGPDPLITPVCVSTVGPAAPGTNLTVVDVNWDPCPIGVGGFLALGRSCPGLALESADSNPPYLLNVKARMDRDNRIWTLGETRNVRSQNAGVVLIELEIFLASLPSVEQVAVVRYEDDSGASHDRAFLVPANPEESEDLISEINEAVKTRFGLSVGLESYRIVSELPHSKSGKLLRSVLRRISCEDPLDHEDLSIISNWDTTKEK